MTDNQPPVEAIQGEARAQLTLFVRESNWIEGIRRDPTDQEIDAHAAFLALPEITLDALVDLVAILQPDARLRDRAGLNVYVGNHIPPSGGIAIPLALHDIISRASDPYQTHVEYETLHPFTDGNGRSGRALWLKMMGEAPLGFLHHWYYQSLAGSGYRGKADMLAFQSEARAVPSGGERIKTLPTDAVLAVTEAILREAREHGADSPVDRGDAEQLAMAAVGAMPAHQADREAIARVIDPSLWERRDFDAGRRDYYEAFVKVGWSGMPFEQWVERGTKDSLAKADAILTLSPTPSARRDGGGDLQIGTRCSRCGMAAPKSLAADCDRPECEYRLPPATEKAEK